jgi:hypothetical protein
MQGTGGTGAWLTLICWHLESILWGSALVLVLFLVPEELPRLDPGAALFEVESIAYWVSAALYWIAMSMMAPFYVAAGFALYLTRRTELEAWDLELVFRRAAAEDGARRPRTAAATACAGLFVLALAAAPGLEAAVQVPEPEEARALIAEVLAGKDFGTKREVESWVYVGTAEEDSGELDLPDWLADIIELIARGAGPVATLVKWVPVLAAALLCALVVRRILLELGRGRAKGAVAAGPEQEPPRPLGRVRGEALPSDVEGRVRQLIAAGDPRAALALLYRATLVRLKRGYGLRIPASATEHECLALVAGARPEDETALVRRLTGAWQRLAYEHHSPDSPEVAALLRDWRHWQGDPGEV